MAGSIKVDGGGLRYNKNKVQFELVPPEWWWGIAEVMTRGAHKYEIRNWERGMKWSIMVGCIFRHLMKFLMGERFDPETGCHHMFMVAWNACSLASYDIRGIGENDLPKYKLEWLDQTTEGSLDAFIDKLHAARDDEKSNRKPARSRKHANTGANRKPKKTVSARARTSARQIRSPVFTIERVPKPKSKRARGGR